MSTGRKTIRTPELVKELCERIEEPMPVKHACAMVGIHEATFYRWMQEAEGENASDDLREFREMVARARATASDKLKSIILRAATGYMVTKMSGSGKVVEAEEFDWKAAAWLAERMFPSEYGSRQKLEHTGAEAGPIQFDLPAGAGDAAVEFVRRLGSGDER